MEQFWTFLGFMKEDTTMAKMITYEQNWRIY